MDRPALDAEALQTALQQRWKQVTVVAETASTNADLLARTAAPDRSMLTTEFQSAGRGRFDRVWTSPPRAGLTTSFLVRPTAPPASRGWLPLLAGVAVCEAVSETTGLAPRLKWPNDVLLGGDKLAGILAQSADGAVVIGIGVNVTTTADELPDGVAATSLATAGAGAEIDRTALLIALADRLDARVAQWDDCGGDAAACGLAAAYRDLSDTIGRPVRVTLADGSDVVGDARDVDDQGHLLVATGDEVRLVAAGDVEHLRVAS